jgi:hypothetical protein
VCAFVFANQPAENVNRHAERETDNIDDSEQLVLAQVS